LLDAREAARLLAVSASTLWRLRVPHIKLGRLRRYERAALERYVAERRAAEAPAERSAQ